MSSKVTVDSKTPDWHRDARGDEVRPATHAGSWYSGDTKQLTKELDEYMSRVHDLPALDIKYPVTRSKAIIAPHAGYSYSGPTAAWAYAAIPAQASSIKRVVLLGPSHHAYISGVSISPYKAYDTPLGEIPLDTDAAAELYATGAFQLATRKVDRDEHSLEMHLPYIRHIFQGVNDLKLLPLIVGHHNPKKSEAALEALIKYYDDPHTYFVISSDFCHWGTRFSCTPYYPAAPVPYMPVPPIEAGTQQAFHEPPELYKTFASAPQGVPIWQSIQYMDDQGMDILRHAGEAPTVEKWEAYLDSTKNTVCGRNPIDFFLRLIRAASSPDEVELPEFTWVRYEQSEKCTRVKDSSVSYASGVLILPSQDPKNSGSSGSSA